MKKFFTLLSVAVLATAGVNAADLLTIKVDGNQVKNGDVIISNKLVVEEFDGFIFNWELKPDFTIESSEEVVFLMDVSNAGTTPFSYCGVAGASTNTNCRILNAGQSTADEGTLQPSHSYSVTYDYMLADTTNIPESVECKGHFKIEAEGESGIQNIEFDINMVYSNSSVDSILGEEFTLMVGNGRVATAEGSPVEVYNLSGARVANEGLDGIYVVRVGGKALKVVVK